MAIDIYEYKYGFRFRKFRFYCYLISSISIRDAKTNNNKQKKNYLGKKIKGLTFDKIEKYSLNLKIKRIKNIELLKI